METANQKCRFLSCSEPATHVHVVLDEFGKVFSRISLCAEHFRRQSQWIERRKASLVKEKNKEATNDKP